MLNLIYCPNEIATMVEFWSPATVQEVLLICEENSLNVTFHRKNKQTNKQISLKNKNHLNKTSLLLKVT